MHDIMDMKKVHAVLKEPSENTMVKMNSTRILIKIFFSLDYF